MIRLCWFLVITGWFFVGVLFFVLSSSQRYWKRKAVNLTTYIIMLTLIDDLRNDHKTQFVEWINDNMADQTATNFVSSTYDFLEKFADDYVKVMPGGAKTASFITMMGYKKEDKGS